jgi:hypothetical protein
MIPLQLFGDGNFALAVVGLAFLTALVFFGAILYTEHRKEMTLIESGQYADVREAPGTWVLAAGLLLLALGLADLLRAAWLGVVPEDGFTLALLGLAALVYFAFRRRETRRAADPGTETGTDDADGRERESTP